MTTSRSIEPESVLVARLATLRSCLAVPSSGLVSRSATPTSGLVAMPFFRSLPRSTSPGFHAAILRLTTDLEASGHPLAGF